MVKTQTDERGAHPIELFSVIIPANNEQDYLANCLDSLLAQDAMAGPVEVIVAANGCTDSTVEIARSKAAAFEKKSWILKTVDLAEPGKANALNTACGTARGAFFVFLDADVLCDPDMLGQLRQALSTRSARYATGTLKVAPAKSWITRRYGGFWVRLPFVQGGAVGAGLFSVNRAGRERWDDFPNIIADDTFVRLQFTPDERVEVQARYHWPMIEGFRNLVTVRKRQDEGMIEICEKYPEIMKNEAKSKLATSNLLLLFLRDPAGFLVYATVHIAVRLRPSTREWKRGR